MNAGMKTIERF